MKRAVALAREMALIPEDSSEVTSEADPHARAAAFAELYRRHAASVAARLHRLCADAELALDLTHDAFVVAMRRVEGGVAVARDREAAWLHGIGFNLLRDHRRGRSRRQGLLARLLGRAARGGPVAGEGPDAESSLAGQLGAALTRLNDDQRDAFVLRIVEGLPLEEAAQILGTTVQTVSYRAKRAETIVRAEFEESTST